MHALSRRALTSGLFAVSMTMVAPIALAQSDVALQQFFNGKEVMVKLDMPGTQKGADIQVDGAGLNWRELGNRLKQFGVGIPKGAEARVTAIVVKKDRIEFQLDGGGFGTFGDDSNTHVLAHTTPKSNYEKRLEDQLASTTDPDQKRRLQRDLDRERDRRMHEDAANRRAAQVASQIKAEQVMHNRTQGGSRFNLRWNGKVPADQLTPDAIMAALSKYVDFNVAPDASQPAAMQPGMQPGAQYSNAQIQNGMTMDQVANVFGPGHVSSQQVSPNGMNTVEMDYSNRDTGVHVTYVNGVVVRYSIQSH